MEDNVSTRRQIIKLRKEYSGIPAHAIKRQLQYSGLNVSSERIRQILKSEGLPTRVSLKAWRTFIEKEKRKRR